MRQSLIPHLLITVVKGQDLLQSTDYIIRGKRCMFIRDQRLGDLLAGFLPR